VENSKTSLLGQSTSIAEVMTFWVMHYERVIIFVHNVGLKGQSHEIGKACRWFHWIDSKFKGCRYMFIFNLNVVLTTDFLKMAPIHVRFSPGFPPGIGFHGEEFAPAWFETIT
jgi:hypothetical protein